jgi:L-asparagine oxygenase
MSSSAVADLSASVAEDLDTRGYAVANFDHASDVEAVAGTLGVVSEPWRLLTPKSKDKADPWSLSGRYGLDQFPWHIDGAVAVKPPRYFALYCVAASDDAEPTELLDLAHESNLHVTQLLSRVVLRVRDKVGHVRYLPALRSSGGRRMIRWDPRVCEVARIEWAEIAQTIDSMPPTAAVNWRPSRVVFVDNRRILHRRPPVQGNKVRELNRLYIY